jgi:hypothetical protein
LVEEYAAWRSFSDEFCFWLRSERKVGYFNGHFCYLLFGAGGSVIGAQVFTPEREYQKSFMIGNTAGNMTPAVLGVPHAAAKIVVSEGAHDLYAVADRSGLWRDQTFAFVATRGATHLEALKTISWRPPSKNGEELPEHLQKVICLRQHETKKDESGLTANDRWAQGHNDHRAGVPRTLACPKVQGLERCHSRWASSAGTGRTNPRPAFQRAIPTRNRISN